MAYAGVVLTVQFCGFILHTVLASVVQCCDLYQTAAKMHRRAATDCPYLQAAHWKNLPVSSIRSSSKRVNAYTLIAVWYYQTSSSHFLFFIRFTRRMTDNHHSSFISHYSIVRLMKFSSGCRASKAATVFLCREPLVSSSSASFVSAIKLFNRR